MKRITLISLFASISLSLFAQSNYNEAIQQGDNAFSSADYTTAIKKYLIARTFDPSQIEVIRVKLDKVYDEIDAKLRELRQTKRELSDKQAELSEIKRQYATFDTQNRQLEQERSVIESKLEATQNQVTVLEATVNRLMVALDKERYARDSLMVKISPSLATVLPLPAVVEDIVLPEIPKIMDSSDFQDRTEKKKNICFINVGYSLHSIDKVADKGDSHYEHSIGLNFGVKHSFTEIFGVGFQAGVGLGFNSCMGKYLNWSVGGKFYPWKCVFISATYGTVGKVKYGATQSNNDDGSFFFKSEHTEIYNGLSLLGGADICFGKTKKKYGGIVNISAGPVVTESKTFGYVVNIGIGLVFR